MQPIPQSTENHKGRHIHLKVQNGYFCALGDDRRAEMALQEYLRELEKHLTLTSTEDKENGQMGS
jgi:hypothetical protein